MNSASCQLLVFAACVYLFSMVRADLGRKNVTMKTLWFMNADARSYQHLSHVKAAIVSAIANNVNDLYPVIMIQNTHVSAPRWFLEFNKTNYGIVLYHNLSFINILNKRVYIDSSFPGKVYHHKWGSLAMTATFLRFDIPLVLPQIKSMLATKVNVNVDFDYVLYTDTDVLITANYKVSDLPKPRMMLQACDRVKRNVPENAGVLYINVKAFEPLSKDIVRWAERVNWTWPGDLWDQGMMNNYFLTQPANTRPELMPPLYHWKPYWGRNDRAALIHFHGSKPRQHAECIATNGDTDFKVCNRDLVTYDFAVFMRKEYKLSYSDFAASYAHYVSLFYHYFSLMPTYFPHFDLNAA